MCGAERFFSFPRGQRGTSTLADKTDSDWAELEPWPLIKGGFISKSKCFAVLWWAKYGARRELRLRSADSNEAKIDRFPAASPDKLTQTVKPVSHRWRLGV